NELLASIPQVSNFFNNVPLAAIQSFTAARIQTNRPNIRSIGSDSIAVSPTLVLVNGHRIAGVGVANSNVDPDVIAIGAIERVDVVTEGGSATYGADAVAGVINFITRRRYDGVLVDGSYGFADNYSQYNGNITVGKAWDTGSAYASYSYAWTDSLFGRDRDFVRGLDYSVNPAVPLSLTCSNPNLTITPALVAFLGGPVVFAPFGAVTPFAAPNFVANTANRCDEGNSTIVPKSERHAAFAGIEQELGDKTTINLNGFYGRRTVKNRSEATGVVGLGPLNPAAASLPAGLVVGDTGIRFAGLPVENRALVNFSFAPVLGPSPLRQDTRIEEYGADLEIKHDITEDWQVRGLASYSQSNSFYSLQGVDGTRLTAAGNASTPTTAINPLNITATNRALIDDLIDSFLQGKVRDRLLQLRVLAEGRLFTLPGGDVRLAFGGEYLDDHLKSRNTGANGTAIRAGQFDTLAAQRINRNVKSVFGELQVPLFGDDNSFEGMHSLVLSAAVRYDKYSDFGSTTNPKFGVTYEPVEGFRLRGNWGTSFTAPSLLDLLGGFQTLSTGTGHPFQPAGMPAPNNSFDVVIQGTRLPLKPQTADTWSIGVDLEPTRELKFSLSYYNVEFKDIISIPTPSADIFTDFSDSSFVSRAGLPQAQVLAFASQVPGSPAIAEINARFAAGETAYSLIDFRVGNYGILKAAGLDFSANWRHDTGFGSIDLGLNGNLQLKREEQVSPTAGSRDRLEQDRSKLLLQTIAGATIGALRAQATVNFNEGYDLTPTNAVPPQLHVGDFTTVNLFFKYDVPATSGIFKDLSFRLNIDNVFDADPPPLRRNNPGDQGFANGFTLGRLFQFGVSKKF
ncbi:MAG: TonB-dependent receptor, partial [Novosphingobium sp.]